MSISEPRPAPAPAAARPDDTQRDRHREADPRPPTLIYAETCLRLARRSTRLRADPNARLRGNILHDVLHRFVEETRSGFPDRDTARTLLIGRSPRGKLARAAPYSLPPVRLLWRAPDGGGVDGVHPRHRGAALRARGTPDFLERTAHGPSPAPAYTLRPVPRRPAGPAGRRGTLAIYDYKSGSPPTADQGTRLPNKQLWIER